MRFLLIKKITTFTSLAAILDRANVDTDLIIPQKFLKSISRKGFGRYVFNNLRLRPDGSLDPTSSLNAPRYQGAGILVSRENFGCGSSREHASWALLDYGFRAVVAPSFGDIFKNNSFKNSLLLVELPGVTILELIQLINETPGLELTINLLDQRISGPKGFATTFDFDPYRKKMLLNGWDDISLTLKKEVLINAYERSHRYP